MKSHLITGAWTSGRWPRLKGTVWHINAEICCFCAWRGIRVACGYFANEDIWHHPKPTESKFLGKNYRPTLLKSSIGILLPSKVEMCWSCSGKPVHSQEPARGSVTDWSSWLASLAPALCSHQHHTFQLVEGYFATKTAPWALLELSSWWSESFYRNMKVSTALNRAGAVSEGLRRSEKPTLQ